MFAVREVQVGTNEPSVARAQQRDGTLPILDEAVRRRLLKQVANTQKDGGLVSAWRSRPGARRAQRFQVANHASLA
jgi:hypothetical protein